MGSRPGYDFLLAFLDSAGDANNPVCFVVDDAEIDEREAHVLSLLDGRSTVGTMLVTCVLSARDIVATLCELRARGVVTLDRKLRNRRCADAPIDRPR